MQGRRTGSLSSRVIEAGEIVRAYLVIFSTITVTHRTANFGGGYCAHFDCENRHKTYEKPRKTVSGRILNSENRILNVAGVS